MKAVRLKNGQEEAEPLVTVTMAVLRSLMETEPIMFYELVMKCRDSNHGFFSYPVVEALQARKLVQADGSVHESIRNVVLSAVIGDGLQMSIQSPIKA